MKTTRKMVCIGILILILGCGISAMYAKPFAAKPTAADKTEDGTTAMEKYLIENRYIKGPIASDIVDVSAKIETFPAGEYIAILYNESSAAKDVNEFGWYPSCEGGCRPVIELIPGKENPLYAKKFTANAKFGLYLNSARIPGEGVWKTGGLYYTEKGFNPDGKMHAKIKKLGQYDIYTIEWEDWCNGGDQSFDDMVVILIKVKSVPDLCNKNPEEFCDDASANGLIAVDDGAKSLGIEQWLVKNNYAADEQPDIIAVDIEVFPQGKYVAVLFSESSAAEDVNELGWYPSYKSGCRPLLELIPGNEDPFYVREFEAEERFGLYLNSARIPGEGYWKTGGLYYTEKGFNPDGKKHAKVYKLKNHGIYIIKWEDWCGGGDQDFDDMVVVLIRTASECESNEDCADLICPDVIGGDTPMCCNGECVCGGVETAGFPYTCEDGRDNDCDGLTDSNDPGCVTIKQTIVHGLVLMGDVDCDGVDCIIPVPDADVDVICSGYIAMTNTNEKGQYSVKFGDRLCPEESKVLVRARKEDKGLYGEAEGRVKNHEAKINVEVYPRPVPISVIQIEGYTYAPVLRQSTAAQRVFKLMDNASVTVTCYSNGGIIKRKTDSNEIGFYNAGFHIFDCPGGSKIHAEAEKGIYHGEVRDNAVKPVTRLDVLMKPMQVGEQRWVCTFNGSANGKAVVIKKFDEVKGKWETSGGEAHGTLQGRVSKSGYVKGDWKAINPEGAAGIWWGRFGQYIAEGRWLLTDPEMPQRFDGTWECKMQLQHVPNATVDKRNVN